MVYKRESYIPPHVVIGREIRRKFKEFASNGGVFLDSLAVHSFIREQTGRNTSDSIIEGNLREHRVSMSDGNVAYLNPVGFRAYIENFCTGGIGPPLSIVTNPELQRRYGKPLDALYSGFIGSYGAGISLNRFRGLLLEYTSIREGADGFYYLKRKF